MDSDDEENDVMEVDNEPEASFVAPQLAGVTEDSEIIRKPYDAFLWEFSTDEQDAEDFLAANECWFCRMYSTPERPHQDIDTMTDFWFASATQKDLSHRVSCILRMYRNRILSITDDREKAPDLSFRAVYKHFQRHNKHVKNTLVESIDFLTEVHQSFKRTSRRIDKHGNELPPDPKLVSASLAVLRDLNRYSAQLTNLDS